MAARTKQNLEPKDANIPVRTTIAGHWAIFDAGELEDAWRDNREAHPVVTHYDQDWIAKEFTKLRRRGFDGEVKQIARKSKH